MTIEYHRTESGGTVVAEALYAPRSMRCHDDWRGRYGDGHPKANRQRCLVGLRIERGHPFVQVCVDDDGTDSSYRRYHAVCYIRSYRVTGLISR